MKNISEMYDNSKSIAERLNEDRIDEGLKELLVVAKDKFKAFADKVVAYAKGICVKVGSYFIPTNANGELLNAISPLTAGQAYKDGRASKNSTFVHLDKEGATVVGLRNSFDDALKLPVYAQNSDSRKYWSRIIKEAEEAGVADVNEVKLQNEDPEAKYNVIVDSDELKNEIKLRLKLPMARLLIWGAPGIGKSAILMNVLKEMRQDFPDYRLIVKTLSNETPDNFTLPAYEEVNGEKKATDIPKTWLPVYKPSGNPLDDEELDEACGKGLLFIDELSRATPQVLNVVLPLVNEGIFNGFKLGSGWTIVVASNRSEDETSGQSNIGNALSNRFKQVYYEPTVKTWRKWADKQNFISPLLTQWLSMPASEEFSGGKFYYMDPNDTLEDSETKLMCTPRSWTNAMRELAVYSHTGALEGFDLMDIPETVLKRVLNGYVPASAVDTFCGFLTIVRGIGNFDAAVHSVWNNGGKDLKISDRDLRRIALPLAQLIICARGGKTLPSSDEFKNFCQWLASSNNDQLASYALDIFKNVYADKVSDQYKEYIFIIKNAYDRAVEVGQKDKQAAFDAMFKPLCSKYGYGSVSEFPNYREGMNLVRDKYQAAFKGAIVNGKEALG